MKKYIAVLLVVISCLFAFSGCGKKDEYYVDPDTVTITVVDIWEQTCFIGLSHTNNFPVIVAVDISCFDKNGVLLCNRYAMSDFLYPTDIHKTGQIQEEIPQETTNIQIDKIYVRKSFFDEKYHLLNE